MLTLKRIMAVCLLFSLAACARLGPTTTSQQRITQAPAVTTSAALSATDVTDFLDAGVASKLSEKERMEAASAQFYALQFGRPAAPRSWHGDAGSSGKVTVGPYVRVNQLDCRDFSHEVTVNKESFVSSGTACREQAGGWKAV